MSHARFSILLVCILLVFVPAGCGQRPADVTDTPFPATLTPSFTIQLVNLSTPTWTPPPELPVPTYSEIGAPVITLSPEQLTAQAQAAPPAVPEPALTTDIQPSVQPPPPEIVPAPTGFPTPPEFPSPQPPETSPVVEPVIEHEAFYPDTPLFDFSRFDPDTFQPIDIAHSPPLIARTDETLRLVFHFVNLICAQIPVPCTPDVSLIVAYGAGQPEYPVELRGEIVDGLNAVVASLPASQANSTTLRYYLQTFVPELNYFQRYPVRGILEVVNTAVLIHIDLPEQAQTKSGVLVHSFSWGNGTGQVRWGYFESYPLRVGPPAFALAGDGRVALLDPVSSRILLFNPNSGGFSSLPLPFEYRFQGQLQFDKDNRLGVFDPIGKPLDPSNVSIPHLYLFDQDGSLQVEAPVYVKSPASLSNKLEVLDLYDYRLVNPLRSNGTPNPRFDQRDKQLWGFPSYYLVGQEPYLARVADLQRGATFELHSTYPLGAIARFERIPQGYLAVFRGETFRAVWLDIYGNLLKDVCLPNNQYSEINLYGQTAVDASGSLYVLGSTSSGIEVRLIRAP